MLAKWAIDVVLPSAGLEAIGRPNFVLDDMLYKVLAFLRCPGLPYDCCVVSALDIRNHTLYADIVMYSPWVVSFRVI